MPPKERKIYLCSACGHESRKWLGRCPECGEWDSLNERKKQKLRTGRAIAEVFPLTGEGGEEPVSLVTGISELDRTLGGGIVPGSIVLIGGDPGIGKPTLSLQLLAALAGQQHKVLYASGEESVGQIRMRTTEYTERS
ncbi:MAG: DNA repair protein RadA, partial [Candidatus Electrothrix sp. AUS4]|nr:DNA repair protein RadA [Candidatus Electrothrix sp. AUS4]